MNIFVFFYFMAVINISSSKLSSRALEGYPAGFLSDCPGTTKEARILPNSLKKLAIMLYSSDGISTVGKMTSFNYYQMKDLRKHLDFTKKTVLYVNGYLDSNYLTPTSLAMCAAYKQLGYNILALEYVEFNARIYPRAVRFLRPVGKHTAEMLAELSNYGLDPKKLEIIGVSHGGHAISFIGKNYRRITGKNITRITALDPSGSCFRHKGAEDRIDASDGDFVEIIHTNIDGYGLAAPVGHVDFYVNGGEYQPSLFEILPCSNLCSHARSFDLWIAALSNPNSFIGIQCDSVQDARDRNCFDRKPFVTNVMGLNVDKSKQGIFYVMANNVFPFAMGRRGLKEKNEINKELFGKINDPDLIEV